MISFSLVRLLVRNDPNALTIPVAEFLLFPVFYHSEASCLEAASTVIYAAVDGYWETTQSALHAAGLDPNLAAQCPDDIWHSGETQDMDEFWLPMFLGW